MPADKTLTRLADWMTGAFSSQAQSQADPGYFDIRLFVVQIWPDLPNGYWLYVEQAAADRLEQPYRQRIYHLTRLDGERFKSAIYSLPGDPLEHAGAWVAESPLPGLKPEQLEKRRGCAVILKKMDMHAFKGSTHEQECKSSLRGASYATSEVEITINRMTSWDRGFDSNDNQVWGATQGPYIFDKTENFNLLKTAE